MARVSTNSKQVISAFQRFIRNDTQRRMTLLWTYVVRYSPVLTGRYRAAWNISIGVPVYKEIKTGGSSDNPLPPPSIPFIPSTRFRKVYLTNGQPYAEPLEFGWSRQAPSGVLRRGIEVIKNA